MKIRTIFALTLTAAAAAAAAAFLPGSAQAQGQINAPSSATLGILQHGTYQCALPGHAGGPTFVDVPEESFRIGTASSYVNAQGNGIYLLRGGEVTFTRGPKKDQRFLRLGNNTLQKLKPDGSPSKMICTRLGGAR